MLTLTVVRSTRAFKAKRFSFFALLRVLLENIFRTEFVSAIAELRKVAFSNFLSTFLPRLLRSAVGDVTATASGTCRILLKHTKVRIAARICAVFWKSTVTFFSRLDKTVSARSRAESFFRKIEQALVEISIDNDGVDVNAASTPVRRYAVSCRSHDAVSVFTIAADGIVRKANNVTKLMHNRPS